MQNLFKYGLMLMASLMMAIVQANETAKTYISFAAEFEASVIIVPYDEVDHYLLHFKGFEHSFDGKTALYKKVWNSADKGKGYRYQMAGLNSINFRSDSKMTLIGGTVYPYFEVLLDKKAPTKMLYAGKPEMKVEDIFKQYRVQQGIVESKVEAKQLIAVAQSKFEQRCQQQITIDIDWAAFRGVELKTTPGMVQFYLESLSKICRIDSDYAAAVKDISLIEVTSAAADGSHKVTLRRDILVIELDRNTPNIADNSYQVVYEAL